jgi:branched-chain amino acid transport system permease protein
MSRAHDRRTLLGLAVAGLTLLPFFCNPYYVIVLSSALALAIACLSLNLLLGYTGMLSLGHALYFGVGAYTGAFLFTFGNLTSLELYLASGILAAMVLASVFGALCVRATHIFFTILTLALAKIVHSLVISGIVFTPFGQVGRGFFFIGHGGLYLPRLTIAGSELEPDAFTTGLYYIILLAFLLSALLMWRIVRSPFGTALRAIRDNDTRAAFIGIPVRTYRWAVFVIAAAFAALAGGLSGQVDRQITPQQIDWLFSAQLVVATVLGGTRYFLGPVLGALIIVALREAALRFPLYHNLLLGVMLLGVVHSLRGGLADAAVRLINEIARYNHRWTFRR